MLSFKWILKHLFPILLLQFTAAAGEQRAGFTVKVGDEVTLPCSNVTQERHNCDRITWEFSQPGSKTVSWFEFGHFTENATKVESGKLDVTADCSLVIKDVTSEDFGHYVCRRILTNQKELIMKVDLSVISMTEQINNENVTFNCSVSKFTVCKQPVVWLYEGKDRISPDMNVSTSCSAAVTVPTSFLHQNSRFYELLKCKVKALHYNNKDLLFTFSNQSSEEKSGWIWWIFIVSGLLAGLLLIVMVTVGQRKPKGNKKQIEERDVADSVIYSTLTAPSVVEAPPFALV